MKNYYKILGVAPTATNEEIKKTYRQLAFKYHPDRNPGNIASERHFKELTEAYNILSDYEKREKYNREYKKYNEAQSNSGSQQQQSASSEDWRANARIFLYGIHDIKRKLIGLNKDQINQSVLFKTLNDLLSFNNINLLLSWGDSTLNRQIIREALDCTNVLEFKYADKILYKLVKLAGSDNGTIVEIHNYAKSLKKNRFREKYGLLLVLGAIASILILIAILKPKETHTPKTHSSGTQPPNGDLNNTFVTEDVSTVPEYRPSDIDSETKSHNPVPETKSPPAVPELTPEQKLKLQKDKWIADGWEQTALGNGQLPSCYNFIPKKSDIDNYLEVQVGSGTDVAIKLMNAETNKCIRYVFINSGTTYKIRNIPEGKFYLKIAYGKDWYSKVEQGQCVGKFLQNPMYEKGSEILDFNLEHTYDGYSIPSFELKLDVVATTAVNTFSSHDISESEFNK